MKCGEYSYTGKAVVLVEWWNGRYWEWLAGKESKEISRTKESKVRLHFLLLLFFVLYKKE